MDYIWLTPFFVSPQNDNGYDVEDYYNIDPRYGTMEDFEELAAEAGKRGIRLMLDMVFNHTSSRHEWFKKAMEGDEKYKNYYIFRKGKAPGVPPTNWESKFGGRAWEYVEKFDEYYLHLFDVSQPDLNWDNEEVRKEIQKVIRFWMAKGVKGFRFDVVNLISKGALRGRLRGRRPPLLHRRPQHPQISPGAQPGDLRARTRRSSPWARCPAPPWRIATTTETSDGEELSMVFSFHHLKVDFMGNEKWVMVPYDFQKLKRHPVLLAEGNGRSTAPGTPCSGATTTSPGWCPGSEMRERTGRSRPKCWRPLIHLPAGHPLHLPGRGAGHDQCRFYQTFPSTGMWRA